jgi:hypothetical protein
MNKDDTNAKTNASKNASKGMEMSASAEVETSDTTTSD